MTRIERRRAAFLCDYLELVLWAWLVGFTLLVAHLLTRPYPQRPAPVELSAVAVQIDHAGHVMPAGVK